MSTPQLDPSKDPATGSPVRVQNASSSGLPQQPATPVDDDAQVLRELIRQDLVDRFKHIKGVPLDRLLGLETEAQQGPVSQERRLGRFREFVSLLQSYVSETGPDAIPIAVLQNIKTLEKALAVLGGGVPLPAVSPSSASGSSHGSINSPNSTTAGHLNPTGAGGGSLVPPSHGSGRGSGGGPFAVVSPGGPQPNPQPNHSRGGRVKSFLSGAIGGLWFGIRGMIPNPTRFGVQTAVCGVLFGTTAYATIGFLSSLDPNGRLGSWATLLQGRGGYAAIFALTWAAPAAVVALLTAFRAKWHEIRVVDPVRSFPFAEVPAATQRPEKLVTIYKNLILRLGRRLDNNELAATALHLLGALYPNTAGKALKKYFGKNGLEGSAYLARMGIDASVEHTKLVDPCDAAFNRLVSVVETGAAAKDRPYKLTPRYPNHMWRMLLSLMPWYGHEGQRPKELNQYYGNILMGVKNSLKLINDYNNNDPVQAQNDVRTAMKDIVELLSNKESPYNKNILKYMNGSYRTFVIGSISSYCLIGLANYIGYKTGVQLVPTLPDVVQGFRSIFGG